MQYPAPNPGSEKTLKIANGSVVALDYKLHLGDGEIIDESDAGSPLYFIQGEGNIVPGLERELEGLEVGATKQVVVQEVPKEAFGGELPEVGHQYTARGPNGETVPFVVKEIRPEVVVVDLNHPLAGQTLHFAVTIQEIREATAEEKEHGHVHAPGGHHHH
jgi:FKBP-type peptidyl-prolyl cis-trans isomerase SlyD